MNKNSTLTLAMVIVLLLSIMAFTLGCNPPKAFNEFKAEELDSITLIRRASSGKRVAEKKITDAQQMQELLDVINSVTYTKGRSVMIGPKGKYRILMTLKDKPNEGRAVEILGEETIFIGNHYYTASGEVDLSQYDAFLD